MKKIKNIIKIASAVAVFGMGVSSCSLDMLPLNDVVLENYWTDKSDVESVVASCYSAMQESGYISNTIVWGEDRSDNIASGPNCPAPLSSLLKGSLKTTNTYCDWKSMYNVINRCNTVLYYAPMVAEKDPNYTESDLRVNIAEVKALRAITYLTLIKTFKDVPFSLEPSIDDNMDYMLPQSKFEDILDALIADLEETKDYAPRRYSEKIYNTAKITRAAMYSILAELYLWRASDFNLTPEQQNTYYRKCIECCDWVINYKVEQYDANNIPGEDLTKKIDTDVLTLYNIPLLAESSQSGSGSSAAAFNAIFGAGNSFESIFELTYNYPNQEKINEDLGFMYGGTNDKNNSVQYVTANQNMMTNYPTGATYDDVALFPVNTDYRSILPFRYTENGSFDIAKYVSRSVSTTYTGSGNIKTYTSLPQVSTRSYKQMYPNWIFYRLTEIMLFRAEAEIELAGNLSKSETPATPEESEDTEATSSKRRTKAQNGMDLTTSAEYYDDAFNLISAVYLRSNPAAMKTASAKPDRSKYNSLVEFEELLMNERRRELLFEGKRYFDLVRQARREGNTNKYVRALISKFGEGGSAIAIKMKQMDFMYMPVLKLQIQVNANLKQNSAYLDEEEILNN